MTHFFDFWFLISFYSFFFFLPFLSTAIAPSSINRKWHIPNRRRCTLRFRNCMYNKSHYSWSSAFAIAQGGLLICNEQQAVQCPVHSCGGERRYSKYTTVSKFDSECRLASSRLGRVLPVANIFRPRMFVYRYIITIFSTLSIIRRPFFLKSPELPVVHFCVSFFAPFHAATRSLFDETQTDTITWRWPEMKCLVPRMTLAIFDLVVFSMSFISIFFHIFIFSSSVLFFLPLPKGYLREAAGFHSFSEQERWTVTELRCTIGGWAWKPRWIKSKANQKRGKGAELFVCVIGYLSIYLFIFLFFLPESQYAI